VVWEQESIPQAWKPPTSPPTVPAAINIGAPTGQPLGACLIANDLPFTGDANKILKMRVDGKSWKEIGDEFGKSPSGARKLFTDLTGIKDYKVKGSELKKLVNSDLDSLKVAKPKKPKPQSVQDIKNTPKVTPDDFKYPNMNQYGSIDSEDLIDNLELWAKNMPNESVYDIWDTVRDMQKSNATYTQIANKTGMTLAQVDQVVWRQLLIDHNGNIYKAWAMKQTSQEGIKAVTEMVMKARAKGATVAEISEMSGMYSGAIESILKGTWKPSPFANPLAGEVGYGIKGAAPKYNPHPEPTGTSTKPKLGTGQPPPPGQVVQSPYFGTDDFPMLDIQAMDAMNPKFTAAERSAIRSYTGSGYDQINRALRSGFVPSHLKNTIDALTSAIAKSGITTPVTVTRGMSMSGFNLGNIADPTKLKGTIMKDPGFLSTSNHINGVFQNAVRLEIQCPVGTKGIYVQNISSHKSELEFIMQRGQTLRIMEVIKLPPPNLPGGAQWLVKAKVV
jgi:hypothetical protein